MLEQGNKLSREVVDAPTLAVFKAREVSLHMAGGVGTRLSLRSIPKP